MTAVREVRRVAPLAAGLRGRVVVPGDKSISHRALLLGALAEGDTPIHGILQAGDVASTLAALRALGVDAAWDGVRGVGGRFTPPLSPLDCGNSGTTARLLLGGLAGRAGATLDGDATLRRRPMRRVTGPLQQMGAAFGGEASTLPLTILPPPAGGLHGIDYPLPVASAQIQGALLLAGLGASGPTTLHQPGPFRDHSERMLAAFGARLDRSGPALTLTPGPLTGTPVTVPGDFSSAAFWLVAGSVLPGSRVELPRVGLNPTRAAALRVLQRMGASISATEDSPPDAVEPWGTLRVESSSLCGTVVRGGEVPLLIDEIPILAVAAAFADGETVFHDAAELRVKESDRIAATVALVQALGASAGALPDGLWVRGAPQRFGRSLGEGWPVVESYGDHRIAMAAAIGGLRVGVDIHDIACISTSYPAFFPTLEQLTDGSPDSDRD